MRDWSFGPEVDYESPCGVAYNWYVDEVRYKRRIRDHGFRDESGNPRRLLARLPRVKQ